MLALVLGAVRARTAQALTVLILTALIAAVAAAGPWYAIAASSRVALGTDGYPAAMADEVKALEEESRANGDDPERSLARPAAGAALLGERLGASVAPPSEESRAAAAAALGDIRTRVQGDANALWDRMSRL